MHLGHSLLVIFISLLDSRNLLHFFDPTLKVLPPRKLHIYDFQSAHLKVGKQIGYSQAPTDHVFRILEVVGVEEAENALYFSLHDLLVRNDGQLDGVDLAEEEGVKEEGAFAGVAVVVVQVFLNPGLQYLVVRSKLVVLPVFTGQICHNGNALSKVQSIIGIPDGWHSPHRVHLLKFLI